MPPRRNVADVFGGGLKTAATKFKPLFELLQSQKAESEADNFARGIKLLELDMRAKASTRAQRQLDISGEHLKVSQENLALRQAAADIKAEAPLSTSDIEAKVAAGTATATEIAGLQRLRGIKTAKPGGAAGDVGDTVKNLKDFQKQEAALKKQKAAFESKQALLKDVWDPVAEKMVPNPDKSTPWPGQLPTAADSVRAVQIAATEHGVPVEDVVEAWSGIEPAFEDLFQQAKRAAPSGRGKAPLSVLSSRGQGVQADSYFRGKYAGWDDLTETQRQKLRQAERF